MQVILKAYWKQQQDEFPLSGGSGLLRNISSQFRRQPVIFLVLEGVC